LVNVYLNVCSGVLLYGVSATGEPKGSTVSVGRLLQWLFEDAGALLAALALVAARDPPTAIATMGTSPMVTKRRRRRCLPISRIMRSLHQQASTRIVSANKTKVTYMAKL
jgi:hypothetical protein